MGYTKKLYVLLIAIVTVVVLIYAESIILPFVLAVLIWVMIRIIRRALRYIRFVKRWPAWLLTLISSVFLLGLLGLVVELITKNIQSLSEAMPLYESNINNITLSINQKFNIDLGTMLAEYSRDFDFTGVLSSVFTALTGLFGRVFTIILYLVFILIEEPLFGAKLRAMYPDEKSYERVNGMIAKIDHSINNYFALKTVVSLLTGFLSYFALLFIGVDAPLFWAFLIFILNYIPAIGSLVATLFPTLFALLQFGEVTPAILVVSIVGAIQIGVGNFLEPKLLGSSLNISPLVVFLTLALWGVIWGVTGMLLSVPITVIMILIMGEFPSTRPVAILLSQRPREG